MSDDTAVIRWVSSTATRYRDPAAAAIIPLEVISIDRLEKDDEDEDEVYEVVNVDGLLRVLCCLFCC